MFEKLKTTIPLFIYLVIKVIIYSFEKSFTYVDRRFKLVFFKANMCTVPLSLETHKNSESLLKVILKKYYAIINKIKNVNNYH